MKKKRITKKKKITKTPKKAPKKVLRKAKVVRKHKKPAPKKHKKIVRKPRAPVKKTPKLTVVEGAKRASAPLVIEPYPREYTGLPFLTLIQFRKAPMLVIVDNVDDETIKAYVLDLCGPEGVDEEKVILVASEWYSSKSAYPVSIEFSKRGMTAETSRIYRAFDVEFVSRVIGPAPEFPMSAVKSVKRRRRKPIPQGVEVTRHGNVIPIDQFFTV